MQRPHKLPMSRAEPANQLRVGWPLAFHLLEWVPSSAARATDVRRGPPMDARDVANQISQSPVGGGGDRRVQRRALGSRGEPVALALQDGHVLRDLHYNALSQASWLVAIVKPTLRYRLNGAGSL